MSCFSYGLFLYLDYFLQLVIASNKSFLFFGCIKLLRFFGHFLNLLKNDNIILG